MGCHRVERPHQPDGLRDIRVPEAVRLQPREGDEIDARRSPEGQGGRVERATREGRARCVPAARTRLVGHDAARRVKRIIKRTRDGRFAVRMTDDQREMFAGLIGQLRDLLVSGEEEGTQRLFPPAYSDDTEREAGYRALAHDELLEKRFAALDIVESTAWATWLSADDLNAWMGAINDIRLVLGTRLDVTEEMDVIPIDDPRAPAYSVYLYMTHLLAEIIGALQSA